MTFEARAERGDDKENDLGVFDAFSTVRTGAWPGIPHYYGNVTRQILVGTSVLMLLTSPLYADTLRIEFPFEVFGALVAVGSAALTNPHGKWTLFANAVVAGVGAVVFGIWGVSGYAHATTLAVALRLAISILFLIGFYFSMKTVRAFMLHTIGKRETVDEFETEEEKVEDERLERETANVRPEDIPRQPTDVFQPLPRHTVRHPAESDDSEQLKSKRYAEEERERNAADDAAAGRA